ncbi:MAG TPA: YceI family protein, partial [Vicinamibacteria bacterium]|nr:YceI family protein [Vicinamibacteria bacterium]
MPALLATAGQAAETPSWRVEKGDVKIVVPLKPGGAFAATSTALTGTLTLEGAKPARLSGDVSMDLSTIDTGIALRNQHLREKY